MMVIYWRKWNVTLPPPGTEVCQTGLRKRQLIWRSFCLGSVNQFLTFLVMIRKNKKPASFWHKLLQFCRAFRYLARREQTEHIIQLKTTLIRRWTYLKRYCPTVLEILRKTLGKLSSSSLFKEDTEWPVRKENIATNTEVLILKLVRDGECKNNNTCSWRRFIGGLSYSFLLTVRNE